jgi:hypothetical protein
MKFVSIIFVVSVASTLAAERGLQTLTKQWNINDPSFEYEALGFDLDYQVSDFINDDMTAYKLYTSPGCKEDGDEVPPGLLTSTKPILTGVDYNADNNGDGVREQKLTVAVVPATIAGSVIYDEDQTVGAVTATIDFCVRFSLQQSDGTQTGLTEVNFLETLVTLDVDLSDGFEIGAVNVEPKVRIENTANQVYLLEGYQCDDNNVRIASPAARNQGSVIRVCVTPDGDAVDAGIFMRSLDDFTFTRDSVSQEAITDYNTEAPNGLTFLSCSNGLPLCYFETILIAAFYSSIGTVLGAGTGSMQFGGARRLRALQAERSEEAGVSEFEVDFGVNPVLESENDSGAATSGVMAATALVVAGAFALI